MVYSVDFSKRAARKFKALARNTQEGLKPIIEGLADDPRPAQAINMVELDGCYRIRQGDYRLVYAVRDSKLIVLILTIGDRKDVYRKKEIDAIRVILNELDGKK